MEAELAFITFNDLMAHIEAIASCEFFCCMTFHSPLLA
jgi:hypothetical protein